MENTLYEKALSTGDSSQIKYVDMITKEAPILATVPFFETTDGFRNIFEKLISVDDLQVVNLDETLPEVNAESQLGQTDLAKFGGKMGVGQDRLREMYGKMMNNPKMAATTYFSKKVGKIAKATAQSLDYALIYNFIRAAAIAASKTQTASGGANINYSAVCVRWEEGENCGLFNPDIQTIDGKTKLINFYLANEGVMSNIIKNGQTIQGYEAILECFLNFQLPNTNHLSGVVNIDFTNSHPITNTMVSKMVRDAEAKPGNSFIYCHPAVKDYLSDTYATSVSKGEIGFGNYKMNISAWNDIPIITSFNFKDAVEANV